MKATIIGAGKTGRGFLARLMLEFDISIVFVDNNETLIQKLNTQKEFTISFFGNKRKSVSINKFAAICVIDGTAVSEIVDSDLVFISAGASNLQAVCDSLIVPALIRRAQIIEKRPIAIITSENAIEPAEKLRTMVAGYLKSDSFARISESAIFCTTVEKESESLNILSEDYNELPFDYLPFQDVNITFPMSMKKEMMFSQLLTRKIFTYNCASAVIAYIGSLKKYKWYSEAANDPVVDSYLTQMYEIVSSVLQKEYKIDCQEQKAFAEKSRVKFQNTEIKDSMERNARDASRKLAPDERIIGPLLLMQKYDLLCPAIEITAAAAMHYAQENENQIRKDLQIKGFFRTFSCISKIDESNSLAKRIFGYYLRICAGESPESLL